MRKLALLSILFSGFAFAQWSNGYTYEATFVVQSGKVTGTQSNFTTVVAGTAAGLKTVLEDLRHKAKIDSIYKTGPGALKF